MGWMFGGRGGGKKKGLNTEETMSKDGCFFWRGGDKRRFYFNKKKLFQRMDET